MNTITVILIVMAAILVLWLAFYFSQTNYGVNNAGVPLGQDSSLQSTSSPEIVTARESVEIINFSFSPAELTIKAGSTVIWTNRDPVRHDVKSDLFQSPLLGQGETFEFKFINAGTYDYYCAVHPSMKGKIIVE